LIDSKKAGGQFVFDWRYIIVVIYIHTMGKRGPQSKFTDIACPNKACKDYGITGHGNIAGNGTYQARNKTVRRYRCHSCEKAFCDSTNTFYYNLRKDESTIDLALSISVKGMSNEAIGNVLEVQPVSVKRWLIVKKNSSKNGSV
jgi:transposase-like protein